MYTLQKVVTLNKKKTEKEKECSCSFNKNLEETTGSGSTPMDLTSSGRKEHFFPEKSMENNYALYDNVNYDIMNTIVAYRQFLFDSKIYYDF